ncbi:MAG: DnaB-like helicase N-terminal domain-containing protein [Polyangia bacterium]|jgi:replicative DNA helicase
MPDTFPGSDFARVPPHNLDAERSALGGVLVKPVMFDELATTLGTDDFFLPAHREIFDAMMEISRRQQPIDVVSLGDELKSRGSLARLEGGAAYLIEIANAVPTAENIAAVSEDLRHICVRSCATPNIIELFGSQPTKVGDAAVMTMRAISGFSG